MRKKCRAKSVINDRKYIETMKNHSPTSSYKVLISASNCCGYSQEAAITILHHHPKRQCSLGNLLVRNPSLLTRNRSSESRIEYSQSDSRVWCCSENFTNSTKHWKADVLCRHVFMVTLTNFRAASQLWEPNHKPGTTIFSQHRKKVVPKPQLQSNPSDPLKQTDIYTWLYIHT